MNPEGGNKSSAPAEVHIEPPVCMVVMKTSYGDNFVGEVRSAEIKNGDGRHTVEVKAKWLVRTVLVRNEDGSLINAIPTAPFSQAADDWVLRFEKPYKLTALSETQAKLFMRGNKTRLSLTPVSGQIKGEVWELWFGNRARKLLGKLREYAKYRFPPQS